MNKYPFAAMAFAVVALALLSTKPAHAYPGQQQYGTEAKISLKQAETIASKAFPGKIVSEELEKEKGGSGLRYSFDINNGTAVHEVGVDAKTGAVLEDSVETDIVAPSASTGIKAPAAMIPLPGGTQGIHFDDMRYFAQLQWVAVPAAQTGDLDLINPKTYEVTVIPGVASKQAAPNGDDRGSTSVAYGEGYLFAGDHGRTSVSIVNLSSRRVVGRVKLSADYDFVRYVSFRHELWVTEPDKQQIEIFKLVRKTPPTFRRETTIAAPDGPEALVFDQVENRAYTDAHSGSTMVIDLAKLKVVDHWTNSCQQSRGLASDGHLLFVACKEGAVAVLDTAHDGKVINKLAAGDGIDLIAYDPANHRLFVPGAKSATLTVVQVAPDGKLQRTAVYRTAVGAHCVTASDNGKAFVCDPEHGRILVIAPGNGA